MIKLFRNIRKNLLKEGKTTNYLKYAIGEIVLVVIGILIALQVNNWNQKTKDHHLGKDFLFRIHRDIVQDTINFRSIITSNKALREDIKRALDTIYHGIDNIKQVKYIGAIYDKALDQVFSPNDNTYRGMVSSGTLGLIQNLELKDEIIDLYSEYDQKSALFSGIGQWMITVATAETIQTDFLKFNDGVSDIFTSPDMLNEQDYAFLNDKNDPRFKMFVKAIAATAFNQSASNGYYQELIHSCERVLQHIDEELK
ncbi:hypothetical protein GCM10007962_18600 [Yeosuana aromativorans]|uniref:Uncharacterized protein n=1 Tax=Yeosuana aromativorans TaxID=288019 RepID=A0A8J3BM85_9FLAO|nr:DUF6090 family protein [Yeosuana aromativorans]GGK24643.1 hypothetical protein GCM10007962_18600 [Yeosuana aromativorans]